MFTILRCKAVNKNGWQDNAATTLKSQVLAITAVETGQMRYSDQVIVDFMDSAAEAELHTRIAELLPREAVVQVDCKLDFGDFLAVGRCDVVHSGEVYELKFVGELSHEHFLQCACYVIALGMPSGILWNTRDNTLYRITIPDVRLFMAAAGRTVLGR